MNLLERISKNYFQMEILGEERLITDPKQNYLYVMNHTAIFGLEVYLIGLHLYYRAPERKLVTLVWKGFSEGLAGPWFKALGCRTATIQNGVDVLGNGENVMILPEGVDATDVRNRFNHFHTGYLRIIREYPVPLIPIGFDGVDQAIPWIVSQNKWLVEKFMKPINPQFDFVLFPKPPIPRPTKIVFSVGEPIVLTSDDLETEEQIQQKNGEIRKVIEGLVDQAQAYRQERINNSRLNRLHHRLFEGHHSYI